MAMLAVSSAAKQPCKFFANGTGHCRSGDQCKWSHEVSAVKVAERSLCLFFTKGNCKFGARCRDSHDKAKAELALKYISHCRNHVFAGKCKYADKCRYQHQAGLTYDSLTTRAQILNIKYCPPFFDEGYCHDMVHDRLVCNKQHLGIDGLLSLVEALEKIPPEQRKLNPRFDDSDESEGSDGDYSQ